MKSVEQFQDGGSLRSMHQGGATFCHLLLGKWGCESKWNPLQNEDGIWWHMLNRYSRCTTGPGNLKVECPVWQTLLTQAGLTQPTHQKWLQELSTCQGKTVALRWMKWSPNWTLAMVQHTISFTTCWGSAKCLQGGCRDNSHPNWKRRVDACEELLRRYETEGDAFLQCVVTGDESWVHFFQPEKKRASKEWHYSTSPKPQKFCTQPCTGKMMLMLFWASRGPLEEHYMPRGTTVTSA